MQGSRQSMPNNEGISRGADESNQQSSSNFDSINNQIQGNSDQFNNSEKNPSQRANSLSAQAPDKASEMTSTSDPRYTQDTPPPEFKEPQTDGVSGDTTPQITQQAPVPNEEKSLARRYLERKATEKLEDMMAGEGTGDQSPETRNAQRPKSTPVERTDSPSDPRRNASNPAPNQPNMSTPKMSMPKQVGPPKMRMPSLRIPKMRF